jgi:hypothetical protein
LFDENISLPEHLGVDISFSIVFVDNEEHSCRWRVFVDGQMVAPEKSVTHARSGTKRKYPGVGRDLNDGIIDFSFSVAVVNSCFGESCLS